MGNNGIVDSQGFLTPQIPYSMGSSSIVTRMQSDLKGGVIKDSRKIELQNVSNCWICEGWSEHRFTYRPEGEGD